MSTDHGSRLRELLEKWIDPCRLQTFEDRERFRAEAAAVLRASASAPPEQPTTNVPLLMDVTNHHNALACPYCNPDGLVLASASALSPEPATGPSDDEVLDFLVAYYHFPNRATMESFTDWQTDIRDEVKLIQSWGTLRRSNENREVTTVMATDC